MTPRGRATRRLKSRYRDHAHTLAPHGITESRYIAVNLDAATANEKARCQPHGIVFCECGGRP